MHKTADRWDRCLILRGNDFIYFGVGLLGQDVLSAFHTSFGESYFICDALFGCSWRREDFWTDMTRQEKRGTRSRRAAPKQIKPLPLSSCHMLVIALAGRAP
ncbi:hypothetical protein E4U51_002773 [Claviceps purpurea]|nr:hypothetical protein E4U51_002773 [Claviceps purpurea]